MAPIVASTEISRSPDEVFAYATDPTRLHEWQESVIRSESSETPVRVGTTARVTRRVGRREMSSSAEVAELNVPTSWAVRRRAISGVIPRWRSRRRCLSWS